jgi:hypothetical protein
MYKQNNSHNFLKNNTSMIYQFESPYNDEIQLIPENEPIKLKYDENSYKNTDNEFHNEEKEEKQYKIGEKIREKLLIKSKKNKK